MATALPSFVTCDICFEVFKEPKSLACRHTFCSPCVDKIKRGNEVECPMCKCKSQMIDIKPDFRTNELVEAFTAEKANKDNNQNKTENFAFDTTAKCCEFCSSNKHPIIRKCKECNRFMCRECKVCHEENTSYSNHTVKSIVSLAAENKTSLLKFIDQIRETETLNCKKRETVNQALNNCDSVAQSALKLIIEEEATLINSIKIHHGNLKKKVHEQNYKMRNGCKKCIFKIDCKIMELRQKRSVLQELADNSDNITLADIGEDMQKELCGELTKHQEILKEMQDQATIEVIKGEAFDENKSTKLSMSTNLVGIHRESNKCVTNQTDYSMMAKYQFKLAKTVDVPEHNEISHMILTKRELFCISYDHIYIYSKQMELKKSIALELVTDTKAVVQIDGDFFVTACAETGLHVHNKEGKHLQKISSGSFIGVLIMKGKIYAFDCETKQLTCYNQSPHHWEIVGAVQCVLKGIGINSKLVPLYDKFYLSCYNKDCIYGFNGKLLNTFGSTSGDVTEIEKKQLASGKLYGPYVCSSDCSGNIIIADRHNHRLQLCTHAGEWSSISVYGEPNLTEPTCAAVNDDGQCIWLAEHGSQLKMYKVTTIPKLELSEQ